MEGEGLKGGLGRDGGEVWRGSIERQTREERGVLSHITSVSQQALQRHKSVFCWFIISRISASVVSNSSFPVKKYHINIIIELRIIQ